MKQTQLKLYSLSAILVFLLAAGFTNAPHAVILKDPGVEMHGVIRDEITKSYIRGEIQVIAANGSEYLKTTSDTRGKYHFFLPPGDVFTIKFSSKGYWVKMIEIDLRATTSHCESDHTDMDMDAALNPKKEGVDLSYFETVPMSKSYYAADCTVEFDFDYTEAMKKKFTEALNKK